MADCPNLNLSPLKEINNSFGEEAAYLINEMLESESFRNWYGSDSIPFMTSNFLIANNAGSLYNVGNFLKSRGFKEKTSSESYIENNQKKYGDIIDIKNVKAIDSVLGKSKKNLNAKDILTRLYPAIKDPLMEKMAYSMLDKVREQDEVLIEPLREGEYMNFDEGSDIIRINSEMLYDYELKDFSSTFLHEMVHKYTANAILNPANDKEKEFAFKMNNLYKTVEKYMSNKEDFESVFGKEITESGNNVHEFMSEIMTNKSFQDSVKNIKFNIWQRIINAISTLFGGTDSTNIYGTAVEAILEQINDYNYSYYYENGNKLNSSVILSATKESVESKEQEESEAEKEVRDTIRNISGPIKSLEDVVDAAIKNIQAKLNRNSTKDRETFKKNLKELKESLEDYKKTNSLRALLLYSQRVLDQSLAVRKKMKDESKERILDDRLLFDINEFLAAYDLIPIVIDKIDESIEEVNESDYIKEFLGEDLEINKENLIKKLNEIESTRKDVLRERRKFVEESAIFTLASNSTIKQGEYKEIFEREANKLGYKGQDKQDYINSKLEENSFKIQQESVQFFADLIQLTENDIRSLEAYVSDPGSLNSTTIQAVVNILNRADLNTRRFTMGNKIEVAEAYEEYIKEHPDSNLQNKYTNILGQNSKGEHIGALISEYRFEFYETISAMQKEYLAVVDKKGKDSKEAKEVSDKIEKWIKENTVRKSKGAYPSDKWRDSRYDELSKSEKDFLNFAQEQIKMSDSKLPDYAKLHLKLNKFATSWYKLPVISKSGIERLYENKKDVVAGWLKDSLTKQADDTVRNEYIDETDNEYEDLLKKQGFREVYSTELGAERHGVPIFFRGKLKPSQQSFDIPSLLIMNNHMAENYKQKNLVAPTLEIIREVTGTKDVVKTEGITKLIPLNKLDKTSRLTINGKESNEYKALESILEDRLYGESTIDLKVTMNLFGNKIDGNKLIGAVGSWTSQTMLMANWLAGGVNLFQGKIQNFIEGHGGDIFNKSDLIKGEGHFWGDTQGWLSDIGRPIKTSKTNLLMDLFNVSGDFTALSTRFANDSRFKALMKKDTLYAANHLGEFYIQSTLMYSILSSIKVMNADKKWINKEGKVVNSKEEAASVADMYSVKDGNVHMNPIVRYTSRNSISKYSELEMTNLIKKVSADLHGQYDPSMQSMAQRTVWGKLVYQLRKWLIRGVYRRWRGVATSLKSADELRTIDRYYSEDKREFEEGTYTTAIRFIAQLVKAGKEFKFAMMSSNWRELTDREKSNIRKVVAEFSLYTMTFTAAALLTSLGEDEPDEEMKNFIFVNSYFMKRTSSEIGFYWNPAESLRIMRSPAASVSMLEKSIHFLTQLITAPGETYETGRRKGEYKLAKDTEDLLPILKQLNRHENIKETLSFLYNTY